MKTKQLFFLGFLGLISLTSNAQVTETTNAVSSASSYVGTSNNNDVLFKRQAVDAGLLSTTKTSFGVNSFASSNSVSIGADAGRYASGIGSNTYVGQYAGRGNNNDQNSGYGNVFLGYTAGSNNSTGNYNVAVGNQAGRSSKTGNGNIFIGNNSGSEDDTEINNCILIGNQAGFTNLESNKLIIDNGETNAPIIWGDMNLDRLKFHAKVGIGGGGNNDTNFGNFPTTAGAVNLANYNLFVKGGILTEEVRVSLQSGWADYVFAKDYKLKTLNEVENYIKENGHLENIPSAEKVKEEGIELGEMVKLQQEKIEELTLYLIQQDKRIKQLENKLNN